MPEIIVIAHNIRSTHNIGSIFRTCDGLGIGRLILTGYSPYPILRNDSRLPHIAKKLTAQIAKTALGAEDTVPFSYRESANEIIVDLKNQGYRIVALEQNDTSTPLQGYQKPDKIVLLLGEEVDGVSAELLVLCDDIIEIPMYGAKESFNVSVACGIALYSLRHC